MGHSSTLLPDGRVLVVGGEPTNAVDSPRTQVFEPAAERWCLSTPLATGRKNHTATLLKDGRVLLVGGMSAGLPEQTAETWAAGKPEKCEEPPGVNVEAPEP